MDRVKYWLVALFFCFAAGAAESSDFVLLIDLSSRMAGRREAVAQTVRNLAITGIHGRMQEGQSLTIWFYDQAFSTNAGPLVWDSRRATAFADQAEKIVRAKPYLRVARPLRSSATLQPMPGRGQSFAALILTDGFLPIAGTPFDAEINLSMSVSRENFARGKKPFLVTLLGRRGEWIAYGVHNNLGSLIELPEAPPDLELIEEAVAEVREAVKNLPEVRASAVVKPEVEKPAPIVKPKVVEVPKVEKPIMEKPIVEKKVEAIMPVVEKKEPEAVPVVTKVMDPEKAALNAQVPRLGGEPAAPEVSKTVDVPMPKPQPPAVVAVAAPTQVSGFPWPLLLAGFGVIAAAGGAVYLKVSQPKRPVSGSLISQSLRSEEDKRPRV